MTDIMFEIPSREDIRKCIVTKSTIDHNTGPTLVQRRQKDREERKEKGDGELKTDGTCRLFFG